MPLKDTRWFPAIPVRGKDLVTDVQFALSPNPGENLPAGLHIPQFDLRNLPGFLLACRVCLPGSHGFYRGLLFDEFRAGARYNPAPDDWCLTDRTALDLNHRFELGESATLTSVA